MRPVPQTETPRQEMSEKTKVYCLVLQSREEGEHPEDLGTRFRDLRIHLKEVGYKWRKGRQGNEGQKRHPRPED